MENKRKKTDDYPDDGDVVEESQGPGTSPPPFQTAAETQDSEVDTGSDALSQLQPPSQEPDPVYRLKQSTEDTHSSVICKLNRVIRLPGLLDAVKRICVVMRQVQLEGMHLANLHVLRCISEGEEVPV